MVSEKTAKELRAEFNDVKRLEDRLKEYDDTVRVVRDAIKALRSDEPYSKLKRPPKELFYEVNSGQIIVETAGVMTTKQQVQRLVDAGVSYDRMISGMYDYGPKDVDKDGFVDYKPKDKVDALYEQKEALRRFTELRDAYKERLNVAKTASSGVGTDVPAETDIIADDSVRKVSGDEVSGDEIDS